MIKKNRLRFSVCLFVFFTALLSGCEPADRSWSQTGFYFDTVISISVYREADSQYLQECFTLCEYYENLFSSGVETSDIFRINASDGEAVTADPETISLLQQALYYADLSGGKIDPTVAPLTSLWDFHRKEDPLIPSADQITALLPHVNYRSVKIAGTTVRLLDPEARIDPGFIAKGYIADKLKELLIENGVTSALINLGGNVLTHGRKPDGSPFTVGIRRPFDEAGGTITTVTADDCSVVSSGVYERYFEKDGTRYHHILDPATGYPVDNGLLGVTVISATSVQGDALSTTCFALGLQKGMELIESLDGVEAIFITDDETLHKSGGL